MLLAFTRENYTLIATAPWRKQPSLSGRAPCQEAIFGFISLSVLASRHTATTSIIRLQSSSFVLKYYKDDFYTFTYCIFFEKHEKRSAQRDTHPINALRNILPYEAPPKTGSDCSEIEKSPQTSLPTYVAYHRKNNYSEYEQFYNS